MNEPRRRSGKKLRENRKYSDEFLLAPRERSEYGATVTARDQKTGSTRTFACTQMTLIEAVKEIIADLDSLPGDWRILTISSPVSIERDLHASRIALVGNRAGGVGVTPESLLLGKLRRTDLMPPPSPWALGTYAGPREAA